MRINISVSACGSRAGGGLVFIQVDDLEFHALAVRGLGRLPRVELGRFGAQEREQERAEVAGVKIGFGLRQDERLGENASRNP